MGAGTGTLFRFAVDPKFTPLLETHDPGEGEQKVGCSWRSTARECTFTRGSRFSAVPAGVPGRCGCL